MSRPTQVAAGRKGDLHFIVSTGEPEKTGPELRRLIRSHVMLGKNRGRTLPPRTSKPKGAVQESSSGSSSDVLCADKARPIPKRPACPTDTALPPRCTLPDSIPGNFGSHLSSIRFADVGVEPKEVEVVLHFTSIAKQVLFPLETAILFPDHATNSWIVPMVLDPAYLHSSIFTSQHYFDCILPMREHSVASPSILPHYLKTLRLLRRRMASGDDGSTFSDSTVAAVTGLAGYAHWTGDTKSARNHMEGLSKIIELRGGVGSFNGNEKLLINVLRSDVELSLHTGLPPAIFNYSSSDDPLPRFPEVLSLRPTLPLSIGTPNGSLRGDLAPFIANLDVDLARTWEVMANFTVMVNSGQRISVKTLAETMAFVMYRLLAMHFPAGSLDNMIKLGLLAYSSSVFLQRGDLGMSCPILPSRFRDCLCGRLGETVWPPTGLLLWLLMVGAVAVRNIVDEAWFQLALQTNIGALKVSSWSEVREILYSCMWLDLVHDKPGTTIFTSLIAQSYAAEEEKDEASRRR